jgi:glycosyltransferase involved in cell wall biosynthesis
MPTTVTMYAALLTGAGYSFTGHANDLYVHGALLREKVARARFVACISEYNRRFLTVTGCEVSRLHIVRCGIDTKRYVWRAPRPTGAVPRLLSVGRLVEKKGFATLINALAMLHERGWRFECGIVGDGPLRADLDALIGKNRMEDCVTLLGALSQEEVKHAFEDTDLFVLACEKAPDGDIDGIPVVLMESMALGVPVVSTRLSGIPELVVDGVSGLLAEPGDSASLAVAMESLLADETRRRALSVEARKTVEREFDSAVNAERIATLFAGAMSDSTPARQGALHG